MPSWRHPHRAPDLEVSADVAQGVDMMILLALTSGFVSEKSSQKLHKMALGGRGDHSVAPQAA